MTKTVEKATELKPLSTSVEQMLDWLVVCWGGFFNRFIVTLEINSAGGNIGERVISEENLIA